MRKGLTVEAIKQFMVSQGFSKSVVSMEWDKIWALNGDVLDPIVPRYNVISENKVVVTLDNGPKELTLSPAQLHPKNKEHGYKAVGRFHQILIEHDDAALMAENEEVTLLTWGNAIIKKITKDANGTITAIDASLHLEGDVKTTKKKVTWIANVHDEVIPTTLVELDYLLTVKKEPEDIEFSLIANKNTRAETFAYGETALRNLKKGDQLQLLRRGFYIVERPYVSAEKPLVLIFTPDGKQKNISTLTSKIAKHKE